MKWGQETLTIMGRPMVHHPTKTEALGDFSKLSRLVSQIPPKKYQYIYIYINLGYIVTLMFKSSV